ncbi:MAG: glycosyltransferase, partial [Planctomycetota bacterium]
MRRFAPTWVYWNDERPEDAGLATWAERQVPFDAAIGGGANRWVHRLRCAGHGNWYGASAGELAWFRAKLREDRPAVVLAQYGFTALRVLPACLAEGVPVVAHFHGHDISRMLSNDWYTSSLRRMADRLAMSVIVGTHQRDRLERLGVPAERIRLVPCGVDTAKFDAPRRSADGPCVFLAVGRLVEKKRPDLTVRAFAEAALSDAKLVVIGDGPMMDACKAVVAECGAEGRVELLGKVSNDEVRGWMERASVFVQHSVTSANGDQEGWPVAIAEAMASGLAVVSTRHPGVIDQVEEGVHGLLVDEGDHAAMGRAMAELAGDGAKRMAMGAAGRAKMADGFDVRMQVGRLEDAMAEAAGLNGGARDVLPSAKGVAA